MLQYVALPYCSVQNDTKGNKVQSHPHFREIFQWLEVNGVRRIEKVIVEDDPYTPLRDEDIEESLRKFDVRVWDWKKSDICIHTIYRAAPNVREVWLYTSGSNTVLRGWSDVGGLDILSQVR